MTSRSRATLLETRRAAELAYMAKSGAQNVQDLDGLPRQMFDHLTAHELAEMAMIGPQASAQGLSGLARYQIFIRCRVRVI